MRIHTLIRGKQVFFMKYLTFTPLLILVLMRGKPYKVRTKRIFDEKPRTLKGSLKCYYFLTSILTIGGVSASYKNVHHRYNIVTG